MAEHGTAFGALRARVGQHLGYSDWIEISQEQVDRFAAATGDHQWIHVDPARAGASRFGGTVAHGYLVLALASPILAQVLDLPGLDTRINYRCERVRFLAPVLVGSRLRARVTLRSVEPVPGGVRLSLTLVYGVQGRRVPVCTARLLVYAYPDGWLASRAGHSQPGMPQGGAAERR